MINFRKHINPVQARKKRYQKICQLVGLKPEDKILNVGCGEGLSFEAFNQKNKIIGLDTFAKPRIFQKNFSYLQGDAADLGPFKNKEFDLVISIGVLEHIFPFKKLKKVAAEIQRVGKNYAVVIPHFYTPLEPHYQLPFWQLYPKKIKSFLTRHFSIGYIKKNSRGKFTKLNYFKKEKWLSLFPGSKIITHNHILGGLIKNYILFYKQINI
jgi:ubiquinone/menaquinone biosynthesis C-methylase UbiE